MKIHTTCALVVAMAVPVLGMEGDVNVNPGGVTPRGHISTGGEVDSPEKLVRLDAAALIGLQGPQTKKVSAPSRVSAVTHHSVGTVLGEGHKVAPATQKMMVVESVWAGARDLLGVLDQPKMVATESWACSPELAVWHSAHIGSIQALASLVGTVYANKDLLEVGRGDSKKTPYDNCKKAVRDMVLVILGIQVKKDNKYAPKVYDADAEKKWAEFFDAIKLNLDKRVVCLREASLVAASTKYDLGFFSAEGLVVSRVGDENAPTVVSLGDVSHSGVIPQNAEGVVPRDVSPPKVVVGLPQPSLLPVPDGVSSVVSGASVVEVVKTLHEQIQDAWQVLSVGRAPYYGRFEDVARLLAAVDFQPRNLLVLSYEQIFVNWGLQVGRTPNMPGLLDFLRTHPNCNFFCQISTLPAMIRVLGMTKDDARKYWDGVKYKSQVGKARRFALWLPKLCDPRPEIWGVETAPIDALAKVHFPDGI